MSYSLNLELPETNILTNNTNNSDFDLGGIASIAGVLGGFMAQKDDRKYKKEMLKREDARIERERKRQDAFESAMKESWGA